MTAVVVACVAQPELIPVVAAAVTDYVAEATPAVGAGALAEEEAPAIGEEGTALLEDAEPESERLALGLHDYLDQFAEDHNAQTWKYFPEQDWKDTVLERLMPVQTSDTETAGEPIILHNSFPIRTDFSMSSMQQEPSKISWNYPPALQ